MSRTDQILAAFADAVLPHQAEAPQVSPETVVAFVDSFTQHMPRLFRLLFPVGLWLLEFCRLRSFSSRSRNHRITFLQKFSNSRIRIFRDLFKALKAICMMAYYSDARVQAALGYQHQPFLTEVKAARLKRYADEL